MNVQELIENMAKNAVRDAYEIAEEYTYNTPFAAVETNLRSRRRDLKHLRNDLKQNSMPENNVLNEAIEEITRILAEVSDTEAEIINHIHEAKHELRKELRGRLA